MPAPKEGEFRGFYADRITAKVVNIGTKYKVINKNVSDKNFEKYQEELIRLFMDEYVEVEDRKK